MTDEDLEARLDRLESLLERQQETIDDQQATIRDQRERIARLEREGTTTASGRRREETTATVDRHPSGGNRLTLSRRTALQAGGLLALLGVGAGTASADPQGQVGTPGDPLQALYTRQLTLADPPYDGTGDETVTSLTGTALTLSGGTLSVRANRPDPELTASDAQDGDRFGEAVGVSRDGTTTVVGAPFEDGSGFNRGKVYTYRKFVEYSY